MPDEMRLTPLTRCATVRTASIWVEAWVKALAVVIFRAHSTN
jgi:hypothetical protein